MNTKFSCHIAPDYFDGAPPLHLTILLDGEKIFDQAVTEPVVFVHEFPEDEADHALTFEMLNKTLDHTPWDSQGNNTGDCLLHISNVAFDDIMLNQLFVDHSVYQHNFNEPGDYTKEEKFYGEMGCNGRVIFKFQQPFYLWLLEHM